jgi:hypothetical protein
MFHLQVSLLSFALLVGINASRERRSDYAALAIIVKQYGTGRILSARHNPGIGITS